MLNEAKHLHSLGMAIHWLRPKSKIPLKKGWTKGERDSWEVLKKEYRPGYNIGVRLGETSKIGENYLACIDFDWKSSDKTDRQEMFERLEFLFPGLFSKSISVSSGKQNGSGHIYVVTEKPFKQITFEKKDGWEICAYSTGRQMVLPPSIHPDSKKRYQWTKIPQLETDFEKIHFREELVSLEKSPTRQVKKFMPIEVDFGMTNLPQSILDILIRGEDQDGNRDQSALAFKCAIAMVIAGLTDDEIVSVLIDREHYALAEVGFKRRGDNVSQAADWVREYCVRKARAEHDVSFEFDRDVVVSSDEASRIDLASQESAKNEWLRRLDRNKQTDAVLSTVKNIRLVIQNVVGTDAFRFNDFAARTIYGRLPPWNDKKVGAELADIDAVNIQSWLADKWRIEPAKNKVIDAVEQIASENRFHPVREYVKRIEWDGVPRIDSWLKTYIGGKAREPYLSAISRKVLCAMVARVFVPGIKFDSVLVLEGAQGIGKSTVADILGGEWFTDAKLDLRDKDSVQTIFGRWVIELGELAGLKHSDLETTKAFISRRVDRIRVSFGHYSQDFPRQSIFIGTTNAEEYLKDPSGERRFWPVRCERDKFDLNGLRKVRDQLFAEAYLVWSNFEESLYLNEEETAASKLEQEERSEHDVWSEIFEKFFESKKVEGDKDWSEFKLLDVFEDFGPIPLTNPKYMDQRRAAAALRLNGFERIFKRVGGKFSRVWQKSAPCVSRVSVEWEKANKIN